MAQAILRMFKEGLVEAYGRELATCVSDYVFRTHYPHLEVSRTVGRTTLLKMTVLRLEPGDVTLVVPVIDTRLSSSDADFEVEVSEGSENWPSTVDAIQTRAEKLSIWLRVGFGQYSHNVFDVTGNGTGWASYRPGEPSQE